MLIHTTPADMLSWLWAYDETYIIQILYTHFILAWTLDPPSPEGSVHGGSEFEGSARSSQWSNDDDTYTCHGDSCEFVGTFAEIFLHENQCEHWAATVAAALEDAEIEDPEIETEMSQAETETE